MFDLLGKIRDIIVGGFEAIGSFFEWVGSLILDIVNLATQAAAALADFKTYIDGWFPVEIQTALFTILGVVVVYKILGREG